MTFENACAEFRKRYYIWARGEFRSEVESEFSMLQKLGTNSSKACLLVMGRLTSTEQLKFAGALVKRFHEQALAILGDSIENDEREMLRVYEQSFLTQSSSFPAAINNRSVDALNRKELEGLIKPLMDVVFSQDAENRGAAVWRYTTQVESIQVYTYIDFGRAPQKLTYSHDLMFCEHRPLVQFASIESWLGLSSQTVWRDFNKSNVDGRAELLADITKYFLNAVPRLVRGLSYQNDGACLA